MVRCLDGRSLESGLRSANRVEQQKDIGCTACKSGMELVVTIGSSLLNETALELLREYCTTVEDESAKSLCKMFADEDAVISLELIEGILESNIFAALLVLLRNRTEQSRRRATKC